MNTIKDIYNESISEKKSDIVKLEIISKDTSVNYSTEYQFITILIDDKQEVSISSSKYGINVLVKNAAQRVSRGIGKDYPNFEAAKNGYKTKKMYLAISLAEFELS